MHDVYISNDKRGRTKVQQFLNPQLRSQQIAGQCNVPHHNHICRPSCCSSCLCPSLIAHLIVVVSPGLPFVHLCTESGRLERAAESFLVGAEVLHLSFINHGTKTLQWCQHIYNITGCNSRHSMMTVAPNGTLQPQ